jgi:hypothetical protein
MIGFLDLECGVSLVDSKPPCGCLNNVLDPVLVGMWGLVPGPYVASPACLHIPWVF